LLLLLLCSTKQLCLQALLGHVAMGPETMIRVSALLIAVQHCIWFGELLAVAWGWCVRETGTVA
jgi:hypothetical protein